MLNLKFFDQPRNSNFNKILSSTPFNNISCKFGFLYERIKY